MHRILLVFALLAPSLVMAQSTTILGQMPDGSRAPVQLDASKRLITSPSSGAATEGTLTTINGKLPASVAADHVTAGDPASVRLGDGTSFVTTSQPGGGKNALDVNIASGNISIGSVNTGPAQLQVRTGASTWSDVGTASGAVAIPVTVSSLPTLPAGTNQIGHVVVDQAPSTPITNANLDAALSTLASAANQTNGNQRTQVTALPSIPAGTNVIGGVTQSGAWTAQVTQSTRANLLGNMSLQLAGVDVSSSNPVPGSLYGIAKGATPASGATITATGTDHNALDMVLRDLSGNALGVSGNALRVDGSGVTQPVSGTVSVSALPGIASDGTNAQTPRVYDTHSGAGSTEYTMGVVLRGSAGTGSVELGTASVPLRVDPTGNTTQPVSAAALPLPAGAATSALQTSGGAKTQIVDSSGANIGTASAPVRTDPTGTTTQPVSAAALPLPSGAATAANQTNGAAKSQLVDAAGANLGTSGNPVTVSLQNASTVASGQAAMANSFPVVIASDQTPLTVSLQNASTVAAGQTTMSNSFPVTIASDQSALPVTASGLPSTVGQTTAAGSTSVVLASNQPTVPTSLGLPASATPWACNLSGQTGTVQCGATAGSGLNIAITSIVSGVSGAAGTIAVVQGTGTNCGTGTATIWGPFSLNQNAGIPLSSTLPLLTTTTTAQQLCLAVTGSGASGAINLRGYTY